MNCYVLVRGPLGVGKTTVSKRLAELLEAEYVSVDQILDDRHTWSSGRLSEFLRANAVLAPSVGRLLKSGGSAIVDGNFYWKTQIKDLEK